MSAIRNIVTKRLAAQEGWAMVTAIILMSVMLGIGLATFAFVDQQQHQSALERIRETAFNEAEGVLTAQVFSLTGSKWPGVAAGTAGSGISPVPTCTQASTDSVCPSAATLASLFNSNDTVGGTWQTIVRDNDSADAAHTGRTYYSDAITAGQPGYDANNDGKLWVRAQATARGKTRALVSLVRVEEQQEDVPHNALLAGAMTISNNGNKVIIDTTASAGQAPVTVRCVPTLLEATPCLGHAITSSFSLANLTSLLDKQITPDLTVTGYTAGNALSTAALLRLKTKAIAQGTFYASCPTVDKLAGPLVWIDSGNCTYTSNSDVNTQASPGVLFVNGTMNFGGGATYWGLIYGVNPLNLSSIIVDIEGSATVQGGVIVDGNGTYKAGSNALNIVFRDQVFQGVKSFGTAGIIQNTWREIKP